MGNLPGKQSLTTNDALQPAPIYHPDNMITLVVGSKEETMVVQQDCTRTSAFFRATLKKGWREGQKRTVELPEESPLHMAYYIQHLYGGKLPTHLMSEAPNCEIDNHPYVLLARMYVLGERMLDPKFQNVVIYELFRLARLDKTGTPHKHTGLLPCHSHINIIYQGTTSKFPAPVLSTINQSKDGPLDLID
jgi:hypothetical protein